MADETTPNELSEQNSEHNKVIIIEQAPRSFGRFNKKQIILLAALGLVVLILLVSLILLLLRSPEQITTPEPSPKIDPISIQQYSLKKLDLMVAKANALYENGSKEEALKLYENIAKYNEGISNYNLGVSRMKQGDYEAALKAFDKALTNHENTATSALNAAVCALHLEQTQKFKYYINLAYAYLDQEHSNSLYYYYLALINYYKGFYPEALQALSKPINPQYAPEASYLKSKIFSYLNQDYLAINAINAQSKYDKSLILGLLNARLGNYQKAKFYLKECLDKNIFIDQARLALMLVDIKLAQYSEAAALLNKENKKYLKAHNRIKTIIDDKIFDINYAQKIFNKNYFYNKEQQYSVLFYFTPFLVFEPKDSSELINQANTNAYLSDYKKAQNLLKTASKLSGINASLASGIYDAINFKLEAAANKLQKLSEQYSQHSVLHYDLALTYALLGKYEDAKKHFLASFHLNPKNYLAGIYAVFCADLVYEDTTRLEQDIASSIKLLDTKEANKAFALLALKRKDYIKLNAFLTQDNEPNLLNLSIELIALSILNDKEQLAKKAKLLIDISNDDILANMLYFSIKNADKNTKRYARELQSYFLNKKLDYRSLFGGALVLSKNYLRFMQISGLIANERNKLKEFIKTSKDIGALRALAYLDIYANEFEESFSIYNSLIDDYGIQDSRTLFLASVAAIGAKHTNSAIALLELSRVKNPANLESRLALALLYLEANNYEAAYLQLSKINDGYTSEFFSFELAHKN